MTPTVIARDVFILLSNSIIVPNLIWQFSVVFLWLKCLAGNYEMKNGRDAEQVIDCGGAGKLTERLAA